MVQKRPIKVDEQIDIFLKNNPIVQKYSSAGKVIEYRFYYDLQADITDLWPRLTDTSDINRRLGFSKMKFYERKGRLFGSNRVLGMRQEWEEIPWQWEEETFLSTERIYSKGPVLYVRATYLVSIIAPGETRVVVYFAWVPRDVRGKIVFNLARPFLDKKYRRVMETIAAQSGAGIQFNLQPVNYLQTSERKKGPSNGKGLQKIRDILLREGLADDLIKDLVHFVSSAPGHELHRIRPRVLVRGLNRELRPFLELMLYSTRAGLLNMTWDVVCPHCRGIRERVDHLWEIPKQSKCDVCKIDFDTTGINALEITFHVNPEIRKIEEVFYCSAEPAKKNHIRFQKEVEQGDTMVTLLPLEEGRYRLRVLGDKIFNLLDVQNDNPSHDILWEPEMVNKYFQTTPGVSIRIDNTEGERNIFIIEENAEDADALRPADLFNFQEFRDIFSAEALSHDLSIDVGIQNILYIDIVGSTDLYHREGNSGAFSIVREYFKINHDVAKKYSGALIKTMGDAVMISFERSIDAVRAAAAFMSIFNDHHEHSPVKVRITLNRGPCLAVNLNSGIDYFGQPVNVVAKLQVYAGAGDIVMTDDFIREPLVTAYLKKKGFSMKNPRVGTVKGYGDLSYWKIKLKFPENI